jgi:hypothetical protein
MMEEMTGQGAMAEYLEHFGGLIGDQRTRTTFGEFETVTCE